MPISTKFGTEKLLEILKTFTQEPLNEFQLNLAKGTFGQRGIKNNEMKCHTFLLGG